MPRRSFPLRHTRRKSRQFGLGIHVLVRNRQAVRQKVQSGAVRQSSYKKIRRKCF